MSSSDPSIDAYIARSADFAVPVLIHLRKIVHKACPEAVETMKWNFPHFEYNGSILCSIASFKRHCAFGFWLGSQMKDPDGILENTKRSSMGHLGRITSVDDLPPAEVLASYIRQAMALIDQGVKLRKPVSDSRKVVSVPDYFLTALKQNKAALRNFNEFTYSKRKDYIEWITGAKSDVTRATRLKTALEWIAEGKSRNWKYERK